MLRAEKEKEKEKEKEEIHICSSEVDGNLRIARLRYAAHCLRLAAGLTLSLRAS